jgi:hypothetical protein
LSGNNAALAEGVVKKLEVRLLEKALGRAIGIGGVGDDDVKSVLVVVEELEAVTDVDSALGVGEAGGHLGEELLGQARDSLNGVSKYR